MKKTKQCPKCESRRVARVPVQPDDAGGRAPRARMMYADTETRIGILEGYVCADCGYFESYLKNPHRVMWSEMVGLEWLNPEPEPEGPYR